MRRLTLRAKVRIVAAGALAVAGCMTQPDARYVYQDGEFGVIGIPLNTTYGKKNFLKQAEELMARHFPEGYEIVRAEEVVEGQRTLDSGKKIEFESEPTVSALNQMIKVGKLARSNSLQEKAQLPILESRIIYKRRGAGLSVGANNGFAALATATPKLYIDPNEAIRSKPQQLVADSKADPAAARGDDPATLRAGHVATKPDATGVEQAAHQAPK